MVMLHASLNWIGMHREQLNGQNVYPVPDGDTGVNMWLTLKAACQAAVRGQPAEAPRLWQMAAQGALEGSRGNSGVILSQFMKGMGESWREETLMSVAAFRRGLKTGAARAYQAVDRPQEGTILTVSRDVAACAQSLDEDVPFAEFLAALVQAAQKSVDRTPDLLPVLKQAGVVDAGGWGLALFLEGLLKGYQGAALSPGPEPEEEEEAGPVRFAVVPEQVHGFDVQFLVHHPKLSVGTLRDKVASMGEYPLVDGDAALVKVHVHTPEPGLVLSWACRVGFLTDVVVENMDAMAAVAGLAPAPETRPDAAEGRISLLVPAQAHGTAVVAVSTTTGFAALFESLGVNCLIECSHTFNPSVGQFREAMAQAGGERTILLPNNRNAAAAAQQACADLPPAAAAVLNTPAVPNGIAAMYGFEPLRPWPELLEGMQAQADRIVHGSLARASRAVETPEARIAAGSWVGLAHGQDVVAGSPAFGDAVRGLVANFLLPTAREQVQETFDLLTIYRGADAQAERDRTLAELLADMAGDFSLEWVDTGHPHHAYWLVLE